MDWILVLPVVIPLAGAVILYPLSKNKTAVTLVSWILCSLGLGMAVIIVQQVMAHGPVAVCLGGWPAPFGIIFAGAWVLVNNAYGIVDFCVGFILGLGCLWLVRPFDKNTSYFRRLKALGVLIFYFHWEMLVSVYRVAWDVMTPRHRSHPDIVHVPLDAATDLEITLLANMVSLTGTLSLDVTVDRSHLIVHAMFARDHDEVIMAIKQGLEKRLLEVTRD